MLRTPEDSLTVFVCECFESDEAHGVHVARPHVAEMFGHFSRIAVHGSFENVIAGQITPDAIDFTTMTHA